MVVTVPSVHAAAVRCGFRSGSAADGHGMAARHDRVPPPVRVRQLRDQRGDLWTAAPRHRPALADVEELRDDYPMPADQRRCLLVLPGPRRHRILPVLR